MTDCALALGAKVVMNRPTAKVNSAEIMMFLTEIFICSSSGKDRSLKTGKVYRVCGTEATSFACSPLQHIK
jgi:hypothetical protein